MRHTFTSTSHSLITALGDLAQNWPTFMLSGFGVALAFDEFLGGTLLAMAFASMMSRHRKDRRRLSVVLITAFLFSTLTAIFWPGQDTLVPAQAGMVVAGLLSGALMRVAVGVGDRLEERAPDIADEIVRFIFRRGPRP
jgi:peptidoglycan/LPS O-acetylase OafA/YrhL